MQLQICINWLNWILCALSDGVVAIIRRPLQRLQIMSSTRQPPAAAPVMVLFMWVL